VLGGQIETIDQVLAGTIRSTTPAIPALAGYAPNIQILSIPYIWDNPTVAWEVLDGEFGRRFFDAMARESGLRVISIFDNGGYRNFSNNVRPIRTPDDLAGLKIRTLESPAQMKIVESLGGAPTPIAWTELYTALQTGVVDGQENSPATTIVGSLHEVQKFYTLDRHTLSLAALVVSEEWFQQLPETDRAQVQLAGKIASVAGRGTAWTNNKIALEYLEERGVEIYRPTLDELNQFKQRCQAEVLEWMRNNPRIENQWIDELLEAVAR
jgi:tripartite ATP-independent transporter DctP family solute receptor